MAELDIPVMVPVEALKFFRAKGLAIGFAWQDIWQEEHSVAFTVAKAMNANLLEDIRAAVDKALAEGQTLAMFSKNLRPTLEAQGGSDAAKIADVAASRVIGVFDASVTGGATDGAVTVDVYEGWVLCKNSAGVDALTVANVGHYCFVIDDETVARLSAGGMRPRAGIVRDVATEGVWVEVGAAIAAVPQRFLQIPFAISETDTLAGTSAELVSPVSGRISRLTVIVQKAITTGGDVTAALDTTAVVGLACTIADAAAKGAVVTDTPTLGDASTLVAAGQRIQIIPGAPFATAGAVSGFIEIAY